VQLSLGHCGGSNPQGHELTDPNSVWTEQVPGSVGIARRDRGWPQVCRWIRPGARSPEQGDRWTWILMAAHTQLRLARSLTADSRRPWEKPVTEPRRLTPARVRRGFPEPPPEDHPARDRTETLTPAQDAHPAPPIGTMPPQRRQKPHHKPYDQQRQRICKLNDKLGQAPEQSAEQSR
jgi:hypothetical protein